MWLISTGHLTKHVSRIRNCRVTAAVRSVYCKIILCSIRQIIPTDWANFSNLRDSFSRFIWTDGHSNFQAGVVRRPIYRVNQKTALHPFIIALTYENWLRDNKVNAIRKGCIFWPTLYTCSYHQRSAGNVGISCCSDDVGGQRLHEWRQLSAAAST